MTEDVKTEPFVQRMIEEYAEVATRHAALTKFMDERSAILTCVEIEDLHAQKGAMYLYMIILERRLARYGH